MPNQWAITNTGQYGGTPGADMKVAEAWAMGYTGSGIKVAVIDTGVNTGHPDLRGNLLPGYDATGNNSGGAPQYDADNYHGTACAGIIGAIKNDIGSVGVAYNAKIIPIRIGIADGNGVLSVTDDHKANCFNFAVSNGADIISNSWSGGSRSDLIDEAISNAVTNGRNGKGCVVLFSAGNENSRVSYPARNEDVIAVGASSICDTRKRSSDINLNNGVIPDPLGVSCDGENGWGSNYGTGLDIIAPGVKIATTTFATSGSGYISSFNGTSAACPNAAGVMALILSANPNLTGQQARNILESTCDKVGGYTYTNVSAQPNGTWCGDAGYGRVNAYAAVLKAANINPTVEGNNQINQQATYTVKNIPSGATVAWSVDNDYFAVEPSGANTAVATAKGYGKSGVLTAVVNNAITLTKAISSAYFSIEGLEGDDIVSCVPRRYVAPLLKGSYATWECSPVVTAVYQNKDTIEVIASNRDFTNVWIGATVTDSVTGNVLATDKLYLTNNTLQRVNIKVLARIVDKLDGKNRVRYVLCAERVPSSRIDGLTFAWKDKNTSPSLNERIFIETDARTFPPLLPLDSLLIPPRDGMITNALPPLHDEPITYPPFINDDPNMYVPLRYAPEYAIVTLPLGVGYYGAVTCTVQDECGNEAIGEVSVNNGPGVIIHYSYSAPSSTITLTHEGEADESLTNVNDDLDVELYSQTVKMMSKKWKSSDKQTILDVSGLSKGTYVLTVSKKGKRVMSQTILMNNK